MYNLLHRIKFLHKVDRHIMSDNFLLFRIIDQIYKRIKFTKKISRDNVTYLIPVRDGIGLQNLIKSYEDWFKNIINKISPPENSTLIDVGANTGQTLLKVVPFYSSLNYAAVEPNSYCSKYLVDLCRINNFKNVKVYKYALSNKSEKLELLFRYREDMLATTTPNYRKFTNYSNKISVNAIAGDELCRLYNIENISIIKIDVEGGEYKVVKGFINIIRIYKPYILCEILPIRTESLEITSFRIELASKLFKLISELGYIIMNIGQKKIISSIYDLSDNIQLCNYIFIPKGIEDIFLSKKDLK